MAAQVHSPPPRTNTRVPTHDVAGGESGGGGSKVPGFHLEDVPLSTSEYTKATYHTPRESASSGGRHAQHHHHDSDDPHEPASLEKHAAALEAELDACVDECLAAAEAVRQLPPDDLSTLRRALRERFPTKGSKGKFPERRTAAETVDVSAYADDAQEATAGGDEQQQQTKKKPIPVPLFIHDLIESVGQMSHWLLIDEPFDDDEGATDRPRVATEPAMRDFYDEHERECQNAGADALRLVPNHARRSFSTELLDEYLAQLAEFPTQSDIELSFDHVLTACRIQREELCSGPVVDQYIAERIASAAAGGPLEGMTDECTVVIVRNELPCLRMYRSPLVQQLKHWAFALGKYFRLLAQCQAQEKREQRIHAAASKAYIQRGSEERKRKAVRVDEAKHTVRARSTNYNDVVDKVARGGVFTVDEAVQTERRQGQFDDDDDNGDDGDSRPQRMHGNEAARPASGGGVVESTPEGDINAQLRKDLAKARAELSGTRQLLTTVTKERNDAQRQVAVLERATGLETAAAANSDEDRRRLADEADAHAQIVAKQRTKINSLVEERDAAVREKLDLRAEHKKAVEDAAGKDAECRRLRTQLESAMAAQGTYNAEAGAASPARVRRMEQRIRELEEQAADLMIELKRANEVAEDAAFTAQSNNDVADERVAKLKRDVEERDETIAELRDLLAAYRVGAAGRSTMRSQQGSPNRSSSQGGLVESEVDLEADDADYSATRNRRNKAAPPVNSTTSGHHGASTWDAGWVSRKSTAAEKSSRYAQRSKEAAVAARKAAEDARRLNRPRRHDEQSRTRSATPDDDLPEPSASTSHHGSGHGESAMNDPSSTDRSSSFKQQHHYPRGAARNVAHADTASLPVGSPVMFKASLRSGAAGASRLQSPKRPGSGTLSRDDAEQQSPESRRLFKSPLASHGGGGGGPRQVAPSSSTHSRADGLNPLIRRVVQEHEEMTHCDVAEYADVASDGALVALCDALVAHQQNHLVQIDLAGCSLMSDQFARVALLDTVRKMPRLRHVRLDGCEQLSAETLRDINKLFRCRAEERAVDGAVDDVERKGAMLVSLRGKELSDEAVFRLCDAITSAGPGSALATELRTIDLRENAVTDDAAMYLLPVISSARTAVTSVLLQGNTDVSEESLARIAKASARKKVVVQLDQQGGAARPYTTTSTAAGRPSGGGLSPAEVGRPQPQQHPFDPTTSSPLGMRDEQSRPRGPSGDVERRLGRLKSRPQTQSSVRTGGTGSFYQGRYQSKPSLVGDL